MRITVTKRVVCDSVESELTIEVDTHPDQCLAEATAACAHLLYQLETGEPADEQ